MKDGSLSGKVKVSVVMPVYNERPYVGDIIERVLATGIPDELIVVDDASTDGTREILSGIRDGWKHERPLLKLFFNERNMGKGAALRRAFGSVTGGVVIVQDADLEYDPADYPRLLRPILDGKADIVYGSRFLGESHRVLFFWHMLGNRFLTFLSNLFSNLNLTDMETGYKAFRADVLKAISLESDRFGFEPEFTAKAARAGFRIYETPVTYAGRTYGEGKKITWRDGLAAIWHIVRFSIFS